MNESNNNHETANGTKPVLCAVCKSVEGTVFVEITNCNLCTKCQNDLSDSFAYMFENRYDDEYPEL